jgi:hypothetical protein
MKDSKYEKFMSVDCSYGERDRSVIFRLGEYSSEDVSQNDKSLTLKYHLDSGKVEEVK